MPIELTRWLNIIIAADIPNTPNSYLARVKGNIGPRNPDDECTRAFTYSTITTPIGRMRNTHGIHTTSSQPCVALYLVILGADEIFDKGGNLNSVRKSSMPSNTCRQAVIPRR